MFTHQVEGKFQGPNCSAVAAEIGLSFSALQVGSLWLKIYKPEPPKWNTVNSQGVHIKGSKSLEDLLSPILPEASQTRSPKKKVLEWQCNSDRPTGSQSTNSKPFLHGMIPHSQHTKLRSPKPPRSQSGYFHRPLPPNVCSLEISSALQLTSQIHSWSEEESRGFPRSTWTHGILKMPQFTADSKAHGTWTFFLLVASPSSNLMQSWFRKISLFL